MTKNATNALRHDATVSDVLLAIGHLMDDCHRESLALQEAISRSLPINAADPDRLETYQHLDHATQVYEDLGRLLPKLSKALRNDRRCIGDLAETLRLVSLRERLFDTARTRREPRHLSGEVSFF